MLSLDSTGRGRSGVDSIMYGRGAVRGGLAPMLVETGAGEHSWEGTGGGLGAGWEPMLFVSDMTA